VLVRRVLLVALAALALVPIAAAKDAPLFDRARAHVGDTVVISSPWNAHPSGLVAYLVPLADAPRFYRISYTGDPRPNDGPPPTVASAVRLGKLHPNGRAVRLAFRVPNVEPGRYVLGIWCVPCNTHWTTALPNYQPSPRGILRILR
jgi:hypothetical protein